MQYSKKIIAFFTTVCLLVTLSLIPSNAVQIESYNMYDLSGFIEYTFGDDIPFDSGEFPLSYTHSYTVNNTGGGGLGSGGFYPVFNCSIPAGKFIIADFYFPSVSCSSDGIDVSFTRFAIYFREAFLSGKIESYCSYYTDGRESPLSFVRDSIFYDPVFDSDASADIITASDGSVIGLRVCGTTLSDISVIYPYLNFDFNPSVVNGSVVATSYSFSSYNDFRISVFGSADEAEEVLGSTPDQNVPSGGGSGGSSCDCPDYTSLLTSILSLLNASNSNVETIMYSIGDLWMRLYYIEDNTVDILDAILALTPSAEETALKAATAGVTDNFKNQFWGEDGDGFGLTSFNTSTEVLTNSKDMLDTGVSVSDFFGMFGTYGWGNWFSAETRDNLDTVPSVSTFSVDDGLTTYEKNLQEIQDFIGGG